MTKHAKLLQRIRNNPKNVSFKDILIILEDHDFLLDHITGSHHVFKGYVAGTKVTFSIPFRHPLRTVYVKRVLSFIDQIQEAEVENNDEN